MLKYRGKYRQSIQTEYWRRYIPGVFFFSSQVNSLAATELKRLASEIDTRDAKDCAGLSSGTAWDLWVLTSRFLTAVMLMSGGKLWASSWRASSIGLIGPASIIRNMYSRVRIGMAELQHRETSVFRDADQRDSVNPKKSAAYIPIPTVVMDMDVRYLDSHHPSDGILLRAQHCSATEARAHPTPAQLKKVSCR